MEQASMESKSNESCQKQVTELFVKEFGLHKFLSYYLRSLTVEERYELIRSIGEECIQDSELRNLLANKSNPICYYGFEPSGRMHIAEVSRHIIRSDDDRES